MWAAIPALGDTADFAIIGGMFNPEALKEVKSFYRLSAKWLVSASHP